MTARIMLGRPLLGMVRETLRVMHVFPEPANYPGRIVALCGEEFWTGDLEWCDGARRDAVHEVPRGHAAAACSPLIARPVRTFPDTLRAGRVPCAATKKTAGL
ncbi:hypothetical protein ATK36_0636 [Amycolatopsis sulphurea]|uniref:Uncharacterized protein n=2 Tax=Amycolatopsis sulphurea TaxID=76022 RepID=A0A2A9G349_9PSEU|nr:hypothetical protein ATK36_0636 [Amycolatopsis sulphurea]